MVSVSNQDIFPRRSIHFGIRTRLFIYTNHSQLGGGEIWPFRGPGIFGGAHRLETIPHTPPHKIGYAIHTNLVQLTFLSYCVYGGDFIFLKG